MGADEAVSDEAVDRYEELAKKNKPKKVISVAKKSGSSAVVQGVANPAKVASDSRKIAENCDTLEELEEAVRSFKVLSICKTATNTVFSDGQKDAEIMLIGEAPGAEEDAQGMPFCGISGKMLDQMLSHIGLSREKNFYITNSLFWRPPGNRRPTPEELAICLPFVEKHIALVKPKLIILVGGTAVTAVLADKQGIAKLRGDFFEYSNQYLDESVKVTAIFHPAYLLRSPGKKSLAWRDALNIRKYIKENDIKTD